ncbi:hypothetical protein CMK11_14030 [Candidatus Poribacteria bacterium]|nr:hypothetical protein [Candidatus Poribacteria bacterium]
MSSDYRDQGMSSGRWWMETRIKRGQAFSLREVTADAMVQSNYVESFKSDQVEWRDGFLNGAGETLMGAGWTVSPPEETT